MTVEKEGRVTTAAKGKTAVSCKSAELLVRGVRLFLACKISALVSAGFCATLPVCVCGKFWIVLRNLRDQWVKGSPLHY